MGLFSGWDNSSEEYTDKAVQAADDYYNKAAGYMQPFTGPAQQDMNSARNYLYGQGNQIMQEGNPSANFFQMLGFTPNQLLNQAESGYMMSPATQNQMKVANSAVEHQLESQGLYGSGQGALTEAEVDSMIASQGMQTFLKNLGGIFDRQLQVLGISNDERNNFQKTFAKLLNLEEDASSDMGRIAQETGRTEANAYDRQATISGRRRPLVQGASLAGAIAGMFHTPPSNLKVVI